jgi:hypothetical protein
VLLLLGGREIPPGLSGMPIHGHHHQKVPFNIFRFDFPVCLRSKSSYLFYLITFEDGFFRFWQTFHNV